MQNTIRRTFDVLTCAAAQIDISLYLKLNLLINLRRCDTDIWSQIQLWRLFQNVLYDVCFKTRTYGVKFNYDVCL